MQCTENAPASHTGDSDDEIAELRIQALLTKRENEAEVSTSHGNYYSRPVHQPYNNTMPPRYRQYGNSYNNHRQNFNSYKRTFQQNVYHPNFAGITVNSSNIVVLTSSENDNSSQWKQKQHIPHNTIQYKQPVQPANNIETTTVTPKLVLPQDKYSRPTPAQLNSTDTKPKQMSARMKRLQGSDSESEDSDTDSSSDSSSSSSSSSDTSSGSDSSSNEDTDSEVDNKTIKGKVMESEKLTVQTNMSNLSEKKMNSGTGKSLKDEALVSPKRFIASGKLKQIDESINANIVYKSPDRGSLRKSRSRTPQRPRLKSPGFRTNSPRYKSKSPTFRSKSPRYRLKSPTYRSKSPRFRSKSPRFRSKSPRFRSKSPRFRTKSPRFRSKSPRFRSKSPRFRSKSPRFRSKSPRFRSKSPRFRSKSPRFRSKSPKFRSKSPKFRSKSPRFRSKSPRFRSRSPRFRSKSPKYKPASTTLASRSPKLKTWSPAVHSRSPRFRSRSPHFQSKSPRLPLKYKQHSRSPLRPFSPRYRSKSKSPYKSIKLSWQKTGATDRRSFSPKAKSYRRSMSPYRAGLNKPFPKIESHSPHYKSRSPVSLATRKKIPVRLGSHSPPRRLSPYTRKRSPLPKLRSPSPYTKHHTSGLRSLSPRLPRRYSPVKPDSMRHQERGMSPVGLKPLSPRLNHGPPIPPRSLEAVPYYGKNTSSEYSNVPSNYSNEFPRSPPFQPPVGRSASPNRDFYNYRQNPQHNRLPPKYLDNDQPRSFNSRGMYPPSNRMIRPMVPWVRDGPPRQSFAPPGFPTSPPNFRNSRTKPIIVEKPVLPLSSSDVHQRLQFRGRDRLLGNTHRAQSRDCINDIKSKPFVDNNISTREQRNFEKKSSQIHSNENAISPFINPSISYKNRAGERHIPYSLFEDEIPNKSMSPKIERIGESKPPLIHAENTERKKPIREVSDLKNAKPDNRLPIASEKKSYSNREYKTNKSSDVRSISNKSKDRPSWNKHKSEKNSVKDRNFKDTSSHTDKNAQRKESLKYKKDTGETKRIITDKSKEKKLNYKGRRSRETTPKPKASKGPRTPSYSPESHNKPVTSEKEAIPMVESSDVSEDLASLAKQRNEIEKKLREEEALLIAAAEEEEIIKKTETKENTTIPEEVKEKFIDNKVKNDGFEADDIGGRGRIDDYNVECRSGRDDSYHESSKKDESLPLNDKICDSKYTLKPDFFNISDAEYNQTEEQVDVVKKVKKRKKDKNKKKKSKDKKEVKHRKEGKEKKKSKDERKKKKKKDKKEHKKKEKKPSLSPKKYIKRDTIKKERHQKHEEIDKGHRSSHRLTRETSPVLRVQRTHDSSADRSHKRKRDDGDNIITEKRSHYDKEMDSRRKRFHKEETNKAIIVTVGQGADRLVTSGKNSYKAKYKPPSNNNQSPKVPVHMRLGPQKGSSHERDRKGSTVRKSGGSKHDGRKRR